MPGSRLDVGDYSSEGHGFQHHKFNSQGYRLAISLKYVLTYVYTFETHTMIKTVDISISAIRFLMILSNSCLLTLSSVQSLSCVWLCNPVNCGTPGFPVHHQSPELAQTHYSTYNKATTDLLSCALISLHFLEFYIDGIMCVCACSVTCPVTP